MYVGNTYLHSFQLLSQLLVHGYKNFLLFFMNLDPRLQLLLMLVAGNLRNDTISHRVFQHAHDTQHNVKHRASVIKLYTQVPQLYKN